MKTVAKTTATGDFKPVTLITKHNMKSFWTLSMVLALFLTLGCSKDEETKTEAEGGDQASADGSVAGGEMGPGEGGEMGPGEGGEMGPGEGGEMGPGEGDPGEFGGDPGEFGGDPGEFGGDPGEFGEGAPKKPTIDPNAPAGKRQLWTYGSGRADIAKIYVGKGAAILPKSFGKPAEWKKQGNYLIYTYDKMRVRVKNKEYSKVYFILEPDPRADGGAKVVTVRYEPKSGNPVQPTGGLGGEGYPNPGGLGGEGYPNPGAPGGPGGGSPPGLSNPGPGGGGGSPPGLINPGPGGAPTPR